MKKFNVFLMLFGLVFSVHAQQDITAFEVNNVAQYGGWLNCSTVAGDYIYVCQSTNIKVMKFENNEFVMQGIVALENEPRNIIAQGDYLYALVSWNTTGLHVVDISDPTNPAVITSLDVQVGQAAEADINNNNLFIAGGDTLSVIDISNPNSPSIVSRQPNGAEFISISGQTALTGNFMGADLFDISDPSNPTHLNQISTQEVTGVHLEDNIAYLGMDSDPTWGVKMLDVTDPMSPVEKGVFETKIVDGNSTTYLNPTAMTIQNNKAYVVCAGMDSYLFIGDVTDPTNPVTETAHMLAPMKYLSPSSLNVLGSHLFVMYGWGMPGLYAYDLENEPEMVSHLNEPMEFNSMTTSGDTLYLATPDFVASYSIPDIEHPKPEIISSNTAGGRALRLDKEGDYLYAIKDSSLLVFDNNDTDTLLYLGMHKFDQRTRAVQAINDTVYVLTGLMQPGKFYAVTFSMEAELSFNVKLLKELPGEGRDFSIIPGDTTAFVGHAVNDQNSAVAVLNIKDHDNIMDIESIPITGRIASVLAADTSLFVASFELVGPVASKYQNKIEEKLSNNSPLTIAEQKGTNEYIHHIYYLPLAMKYKALNIDNSQPGTWNISENVIDGEGMVTDLEYFKGVLAVSKQGENAGTYFYYPKEVNPSINDNNSPGINSADFFLFPFAYCPSPEPSMLAMIIPSPFFEIFLWLTIDGYYCPDFCEIYGSIGLFFQLMQLTFGVLDVESLETVQDFQLQQNYPNPFNPATVISFTVSSTTDVKLEVYDINGRLVQTLVNRSYTPGSYSTTFKGTGLAAGTYFYKIASDNFTAQKKMVLIK